MSKGAARGDRPPGRLASTLFAAACWLTAAVELLVAFAIRHEDWFPPAAFISFGPRWIWLAPPLALAVLARRRVLLVPLAAATLTCLFAVMQLNAAFAAAGDRSPGDLTILSLNAETRVGGRAVAALARDAGADLVLLQEVRGDDAVAALDGWSTHCAGGLCLASRWPLSRVDHLRRRDKSETAMALAAEVQTPRGPLSVFAIHLETVREGVESAMNDPSSGERALARNLRIREAESAAVTAWIRARATHAPIVGGDFNMPTDSAVYRRHWHGWRNAFEDAGIGFGYTKYTRWWGIRIDHVLTSRDWEPLRARVGPDVGSDHRPLIVVLRSRLTGGGE